MREAVVSFERFLGGTVLAIALAGAGCRTPLGSTGALDGTWRGAIVDSAAGAGTATLVMSQTGQGVSGTWSAAFANGATTIGGSLGGSTAGALVSLFLTPTSPIVCPSSATLSGTLSMTATRSGNRLNGTYVVLTCTGATDGTIDLTR